MPGAKIDPGKITKPIQTLAVLIAGLVILVGLFLESGLRTEDSRLQWLLLISAIVLVPLFVGLVFLLQTRFRPHLQDDRYYSQWLKQQREAFKGFRPENLAQSMIEASGESSDSSLQGEQRRVARYADNQGLFLVHRWRPSTDPDQVADIVIELAQHRDGPLSGNRIDSLTYYLGPKFFKGRPVIKTNTHERFKLEISAYGPVLCLAEVSVRGKEEPIVLERYVDFDMHG